jgi:hypothetical protein
MQHFSWVLQSLPKNQASPFMKKIQIYALGCDLPHTVAQLDASQVNKFPTPLLHQVLRLRMHVAVPPFQLHDVVLN